MIAVVATSNAKVRLVASLPNFEGAYFGTSLKSEKPYTAIQELRKGTENFAKIHSLLTALADHSKPLPEGATDWDDINELARKAALAAI